MADNEGFEISNLSSPKYENRCLYTKFTPLTEMNSTLKRYCLALAWH